VMMENRSFDHVLGYLAQLTGRETSDGLRPDLITFLKEKGFPVSKLKDSGIVPNALGFKTRFPAPVGHKLHDVTEQLSERLVRDGKPTINSPNGFLSNFKDRAAKHEGVLKVEDVLGFYEGDELPFFKFLVDNYAYCERFFCSHPGPTLPNRMFSLTGDLQYDRTGEAIPDNNNGDNFFLSRAMTIFDLLSRKGVDWRVYESFPSVTMLRMFARYAADNTNIVKLDRLNGDVEQGNLPAVTIIDPAMHHYPENDDHSPVADMYNGQLFLKGIYDTLRSNEALWQKTMLVITYDEHGGFYDHVIPPLAEVRTRQMVVHDPNRPDGNGPFATSPLLTTYGVRVPTFVVSPWTPAGKGPDNVLDFCSLLKTVIVRFCGGDKPFLSDRVHFSRSLEAYLTEAVPRMNVPKSPDMPLLPEDTQRRTRGIETDPVYRKEMIKGNVDYHDLSGMVARLIGR
jgi:phospholipase C